MKANITIYKSFGEVSAGYNRDVFYILERIRLGKSKDIIDRIRKGEDLKKNATRNTL